MKTVVVLGTLGMAGHIMAEYLRGTGEYNVLGVARKSGKGVSKILDVLDFKKLEHYLKEIKADVVVNCIGVLVSKSNNDVASAILVNSYLPHFLAGLGDKLHFQLVHISTDCVFSGKEGGYKESSFRDGDDNYARTKALGEVNSSNHLTIRTSIIGPELKANGTGLMGWFFKQSGTVTGYSKAYWSGVTTLELAKAVCCFIQQDIRGLLQLCPESKISKFELLGLMNKVWGRGCVIKSENNYKVDKSLVCTRSDFLYQVKNVEKMLDELKGWTQTHADYYPHYHLS